MDEQLLSRGTSSSRSDGPSPSLGAVIWRPLLAAFLVAGLLFAAAFYAPPRLLNTISWHLYLDRVHPVFVLPIGWEGRIALGAVASGLGFFLTFFIGLVAASFAKVTAREEEDSWALQPVDSTVLDEVVAEEPAAYRPVRFAVAEEDLPARNKLDAHPDDAPRPPLSAERDLPAGGLLSKKPVEPLVWPDLNAQVETALANPASQAADQHAPAAPEVIEPKAELADLHLTQDQEIQADDVADSADKVVAPEAAPAPEAQAETRQPTPESTSQGRPLRKSIAAEAEMILADLAPERFTQPGSEPWLQTVESTGPAKPHPSDMSLSAMLARLESSLRRRKEPVPQAEVMPVPVPDTPPVTVEDHKVDIALEAALSTLHRMNLRAVG
jgi:hypothetical protein